MAWIRVKVSPKISSHSAGWMARVYSSVRSWRILRISTQQSVAIRLTRRRAPASGGSAGSPGHPGGRGSAEAASEGPGRGSVFTVRLPAMEPPDSSRAHAPARAAVSPRDVLVVEDNADARDTLRRMLELEGHRVRVATDGVSALEAVRAAPPEIALIDIGLPRMDGYELARRIRAELSGRQPLLVAITGYGLPQDRNLALEAGFDLHLVKPVDAQTLARVLVRH